MNQHKQLFERLAAAAFWLAVWQCAAMAVGQEVFLVSPVQALRTLLQLLPQAEFWQRVGFSSGRILLGFGLGVVVSVFLAAAAQAWHAAEVLLAPVLQLVKATPVASFIILALVWVRGASLSVLISFLMVLPVLYGAVRTGIRSADPQLLEMAKVFRLPLAHRLRAVWLPAVLPAFRQGCSVALGICWKSGVAAEVIGLPNGSIGDALYRAKITLSTGELFAWTFVIILLSAGENTLSGSLPHGGRPGGAVGPQRLGQDHPAAYPHGAGHAHCRLGAGRGPGRGSVSGGQALPAADGAPERDTGAARQ